MRRAGIALVGLLLLLGLLGPTPATAAEPAQAGVRTQVYGNSSKSQTRIYIGSLGIVKGKHWPGSVHSWVDIPSSALSYKVAYNHHAYGRCRPNNSPFDATDSPQVEVLYFRTYKKANCGKPANAAASGVAPIAAKAKPILVSNATGKTVSIQRHKVKNKKSRTVPSASKALIKSPVRFRMVGMLFPKNTSVCLKKNVVYNLNKIDTTFMDWVVLKRC